MEQNPTIILTTALAASAATQCSLEVTSSIT